MIFSALYQQEPIPSGGILFQPEQLLRWEGTGDAVIVRNDVFPRKHLKLWFATIDPAIKDSELNDPTGFLVWAITPIGQLLLMEDHTARMRGSTDLIPLMKRVKAEHKGIQFYIEDQAHGTEVIRACEREGLLAQPLKADRNKVVRWIGAQPAFANGKVFLPARGAEAVVREMLENPGARHDDRMDCVAYAVQVWRDRGRLSTPPRVKKVDDGSYVSPDTHPADRPERDTGKTRGGLWRP